MATPVFCCGFECGVNTLSTHWGPDASTIAPTFDTTTKRTGDRSLRIGGFTNTTDTCYAKHNGDSSANILTARFYLRLETLSSLSYVRKLFGGTIGNTGYGLYLKTATGELCCGRSSTLTSAGTILNTGQWYKIDVKINISGATKTVDAKVDGIDLTQHSDTVLVAFDGNVYINCNVAYGSGGTFPVYYIDDFVLSNTDGDYPLGSGYVNHFVPTADGSHNIAGSNDFERSATGTDIINSTTTAYQLIDDVPLKSGTPTEFINLIAPPNATDYVEVVFGPAPGISTPTTGPRAVEAIVAIAAQSTTANNLRIALNDNGTTDDIRNANVGSTTCIYSRKHYSDPPSAASAWGVTSGNGNFNNVRMRCYTNDAAPDPYWASAMIEAEFLESTTTDQTQTGKARIQKVVDATQPGKSNIRNTTDQTQSGKTAIRVTTDRSQSGKANISITTDQTQTGVARITATTDRTQPGKAAIRNTADNILFGVARITATTDQIQSGKAAIRRTEDQIQTGTGNIRNTTDQTQTGKGFIQATVDQTQTGKGNIRATTDQAQSGKANILVTGETIQTIDGRAAIRKTTDQVQAGGARIQATADQVQSGVARIEKIIAASQDGAARIQTITDVSQPGIARIGNIIEEDQTGVSRIQRVNDISISGVANVIPAITDQFISGVANIRNNVDQNITGKALITVGIYNFVCNQPTAVIEKEPCNESVINFACGENTTIIQSNKNC